MPDSSTPVATIARVSSRSASLDAIGWRISTISWSDISLRAHWMMPMPMNSRAPLRVRPSASVEAPRPAKVVVTSPISRVK